MKIEVKGRNLPVSDDLKDQIARRFRVIDKQVSEFAQLEVELFEEHNPSIADCQVAEATLHLKGVTLRAHSATREMDHSIVVISEELGRQVKRHRDKRRKRREAHAQAAAEAAALQTQAAEAFVPPELGAAVSGVPSLG
jgi:putative sigma-54 modulation protein